MATNTPPPRPPKPARIGRFKIGLNVVTQLIVAVLILFMLNFFAFNHYKRWDFSRTHFFSLSDKTKRVLAGLKKKTKAIVFFPASANNATIASVSDDVNSLLKEYQYASNGKMEVELVDPYRNQARAEELQHLYKFGGNENLVILDCDGRKKFVDLRALLDLDTSGGPNQAPEITGFKGEQAITAALLELTDDKPNILYAVTGNGERDISTDDFSLIKDSIERENIKIQKLDLKSVDAVPADAGMLLIQGARYDFNEHEVKLLLDYWDKKGRLLVLLDPNSQKDTPNLMAFLAGLGIKPDDDRILRVKVLQLGTMTSGELVRYVTTNFIEGSPITKVLGGVTGLFQGDNQSLTLDGAKAQAAGLRLQKLAQATEGYWGARNYNIAPGDPAPIFLPNRDKGQPLFVAASVEKGALAHVNMDNSSRMVVVGNCDTLVSRSLSMPNMDFTINSMDWLLDREELISIAPKDYTVLTVNFTDTQMSHILTVTMFVIPGIVGVLGLALWWKRRH